MNGANRRFRQSNIADLNYAMFRRQNISYIFDEIRNRKRRVLRKEKRTQHTQVLGWRESFSSNEDIREPKSLGTCT